MTRCWVTDASPLIFLAKLNRLELLKKSAAEVLVPPAALVEVLVRPDAASLQVGDASESWLRTRSPTHLEDVERLKVEIGPGESEAIVLACEVRADRIVLDDLEARRVARRLGLKPVGTLGLLLAARLRGELSSVTAEIQELRRHGFRASDSLVEAIQREAGE
jgi:predicted nucleic acid-binding protein